MARRRRGTVRRTRSAMYRGGRILGDLNAVLHPRRLPRRIVNKWIGRNVVSRLFR